MSINIVAIETIFGEGAMSFPQSLPGDYILLYGTRDGSSLSYSLPTGYTDLLVHTANRNSTRLCYRVVTEAGQGTYVATNGGVIAILMRGVSSIGSFDSSGSNTYPGLTITEGGASTVFTFVAARALNLDADPTLSGGAPTTLATVISTNYSVRGFNYGQVESFSGGSIQDSTGTYTGTSVEIVAAGGGSPVAVNFTGTVPTLNGTESEAFSESVASYFSGSETPFAYSVQAGTLPAGLTLNTSTGVISGTPTTAGTSSGIVIRATDATPDVADTNAFDIVIAAVASAPVSFTGTVPAQSWTESAAITPLDLSAYFAGDLTPFSYAVTTGPLPVGLSLNTSTGIISGTPTTPAAAVSIVVTATDTGANTASTNAFDVTITAEAALSLRLRFVIDSAIGSPLGGKTYPTMVVFDAAGYSNVTATFAAPVSDGSGVITLDLGAASGNTHTAGEWVWVGCAEQAGTPGIAGFEINGILTRVLVESYTP